ncbi:MAG: DUF3560 domain-containing protein [Thiolinea sp.]
MNTYVKFAPNVFIAKCNQRYEKGETILLTTKYGKENECIVFNFIGQKDDNFYYSIVRADGFNFQEHAKKRAEKLQNAALNAEKKSTQYWEASNEGRDFLALGEPIKIGHHSEKKHRALIERNHNRMNKSVELSKVAENYQDRVSYWEDKAQSMNLSMPECIEFYEYKLEAAKMKHEGLKNGTIERSHSFSLTYAKKDVNEAEKNLKLAQRLWA